MSWTKRQFIEQALDEIGLGTYTFDAQPEQYEAALRKLDAMMANWNSRGIRVGYPMPSSPENSDLDAETNVPDVANEAIYTNLAVSMCPSYGKAVVPELKQLAKRTYDYLLAFTSDIIERQFPSTLPKGAGNKPWRYRSDNFFPDPNDPLQTGKDGEIDFY